MTGEGIMCVLNNLNKDFTKFAKNYSFIKEYKVSYEGMGQYQIVVHAKEAEYIMDTMLPKTMIQNFEELFGWFNTGCERLGLYIIVE